MSAVRHVASLFQYDNVGYAPLNRFMRGFMNAKMKSNTFHDLSRVHNRFLLALSNNNRMGTAFIFAFSSFSR